MTCRTGQRHEPTNPLPRPTLSAIGAFAGDEPGSTWTRRARTRARATDRLGSADLSAEQAFSPFVLRMDDSESLHADPPGTSLALPDRLARNQQDRSLHACWRTLRTLPPSTRTPCRAARRHGWDLVGRRNCRMARRSRPATSPATDFRSARGHPDDPKARLSRDRTSQSRPDVQRAALAQPRRALPTLSHDPRRAGTPEAPVVECLSPARVGRPLLRSIRLEATATREGRRERSGSGSST